MAKAYKVFFLKKHYIKSCFDLKKLYFRSAWKAIFIFFYCDIIQIYGCHYSGRNLKIKKFLKERLLGIYLRYCWIWWVRKIKIMDRWKWADYLKLSIVRLTRILTVTVISTTARNRCGITFINNFNYKTKIIYKWNEISKISVI